jgi:phosphoglycolate phosphatase
MNSMLCERGIKPLIDRELYQSIFGFPVIEYYQKAGLNFDQEPFDLLSRIFLERYHEENAPCVLYPGVTAVLDDIKSRGIKQIILSATDSEHLTQQMKPFALTGYFETIIGLDNIYASSKTAAGVQWIQQNQIGPANVLMIGDSLHDHEVATKIGCPCLLIANGHQGRERLSSCGCVILNSVLEVPDYLEY